MGNSVLVVHTSDDVYTFLKCAFEDKGFEVFHEKDGVNALKTIVETDPSLIFFGVEIPSLHFADILNIVEQSKADAVTCIIGENGTGLEAAKKVKVDGILNRPLDNESAKETLDSLLIKMRKKSIVKKDVYKSEIFLTHLLEHIRIAIISIDKSGRILSFNRKAQKLWGYQSNFIIGRHFDILCVHSNKGCAPLFIAETLKNGSYEGVLLFERADASRFPGNLQTSVIKGDHGDEGIVVVIRDLTKQRALEHKLLERRKLATLGMVVEGVAHEVRNPLISIGGFARRLLKKVDEGFEYRNYLKVIVDDVSRLETMVKDIENYVHFTKLHKTNFKKARIEKVLDMAIDLIDAKRLRNINIVTEYDPTITSFFLDIGYLVEMFFNLIENAIEAMASGGNLTITTIRDNNSYCIVKIVDTGIGIPDDKVDEIFDLFYTTKMSGVGLGLAKVHIIADEHNGKINIESAKGKGTTVTVTLPLERRQKIRR
jgi:PAS domain S-box-containing protein